MKSMIFYSKKTTVVLLMITHVLYHGSRSQTIKMKQLTYPVLFGGNATFLCTSNQSSIIGRPRYSWSINSKLIVRDRTSAYHSKYITTLLVNYTGIYYELLVIDFSYLDVNCHYRCDINFDSEEIFLPLNEDGFIGKPEVLNWNSNETSCNLLSISVIIEQVYPRPTCELFYEATNLTRFLNTTYQKDGYFYRAKLDINYLPCDDKCRDEIQIFCIVGRKKYPIMKQRLNKCEGNADFNLYQLVMIVSCILICLVVLPWTVYRLNYNSSHGLNSEHIDDPAAINMLAH